MLFSAFFLNDSLVGKILRNDSNGGCFLLHSTNDTDILFGWEGANQLLDEWTITGNVTFGVKTEGTGYAVFTSTERTEPTITTSFSDKTTTGFRIYVEDPDGRLTDAKGYIVYYLVVGAKIVA